nr:immunoglobulin heavy chain junction region [Macaca mulatta]
CSRSYFGAIGDYW